MSEPQSTIKRKVLWAAGWIAVGTYLLLMNHGIVPQLDISITRDWPAILIVVGVILLLKAWDLATQPHRPETSASAERSAERERVLDALRRGDVSAEDAAEQLKHI
jgi:hypothetical protein